jgi:hypothetical protein
MKTERDSDKRKEREGCGKIKECERWTVFNSKQQSFGTMVLLNAC